MKKYLILILGILLYCGCGKKSDAPPDQTPIIKAPGKASLLLPAANAACTTGVVISSTQSTITFNWTTADAADSYDIVIKNLLTAAVIQQSVTTNQTSITLDRNTPYSWYIVSKSSTTALTTLSDAAKFYNAGLGIINYAPFPAEALSPAYGATLSPANIALTWNGSSVDNNIAGYDVYFGTSATPPLFKSNVTNTVLNTGMLLTGTQYYWRIVTRDVIGNTSTSDIFVFKIN